MRILILFLAALPTYANTCTLPSGTYATLASTAGLWTGTGCTGGGYVPASPDIAVIASGATLTIANGETLTLGSSAAAVGNAITINGTNSSSFGSVTVAYGGTLALSSFDVGSNQLGLVSQYGRLIINGAVTGTPKVTSRIQCTGMCSIVGSDAAHRATASSTGKDWSNVASTTKTNVANTASTGPSTYWAGGNVYVSSLAPWISNAGGTALGSLGDTSLSFTGTSCSPTCSDTMLTTEVADPSLVNGSGKYSVDYRRGFIWWYMTSGAGKTTSFTANYKKLSIIPWSFAADSTGTYSAFTANYAQLSYMGWDYGTNGGAIHLRGKKPNGTSQEGSVTNTIFEYCQRPIHLRDMIGTSGSPIQITDNQLDCGYDDGSGYSACIFAAGGPQSYVDVKRNVTTGGVTPFFTPYFGTFTNWVIDRNVHLGTTLFVNNNDLPGDFPGTVFSNNVVMGMGSLADSRCIGGIWGSAVTSVTISGNLLMHCMRGVMLGGYLNLTDNTMLDPTHHGHSAPFQSSSDAVQWVNTNITGGLVYTTSSPTSALDLGYNKSTWCDNCNLQHITLNSVAATNFPFTDRADNVGPNLLTKLTFKNNLITNGSVGVQNNADTSSWMQRMHITDADYNNVAGNTSNYSGWNRFATFSGITNVTGVMLHNPSASSISGKTLTWTYTSATDITLTWDGGSPVQLVLDSGTATAATNSTYNGTLSDSGKTWATAQNNAATPIGTWVKITGGTGSGQIRRVMKTTATQLTVAPAWTTTPDATSTYSLIKSEVALTAGDASTVLAGIDYRSAPTTTQSDTSVGMTLNSTSTPATYAYSSGSLALWDAAMGGSGTEWAGWLRLVANPLLITQATAFIRRGFTPANPGAWCGGSDGESMGAIQFCAAGKAMVGAISQ